MPDDPSEYDVAARADAEAHLWRHRGRQLYECSGLVVLSGYLGFWLVPILIPSTQIWLYAEPLALVTVIIALSIRALAWFLAACTLLYLYASITDRRHLGTQAIVWRLGLSLAGVLLVLGSASLIQPLACILAD